jgi:hypothetical protein
MSPEIRAFSRGGESIMFRINIRTAGFATLIAGLLAVPGVVWAQTVSFPVSGTCFETVIDMGTVFTDEEGILHIRNQVSEYQCFGTLNISQTATINVNIDLATGEGDASLKAVQVTDIYEPEICQALGAPTPCSGTCQATASAEIIGGYVFNDGVGNRCTGDLEGLQWRLMNVFPAGALIVDYQGFVFVVGQS